MERIDKTIDYKGYKVHIFRGLADSNDSNFNQEIKIKLSKTGENIKGELILSPLWIFDEDEIDDPNFDYKLQYQTGDYFQQTFSSNPKRQGIGSTLHDFIIDHKDDCDLNNVFSTNSDEDDYGITIEANSFWENRVDLDKAEKDETLNRFKIKFT
ncbi:hypothetical protein [Flavobacterium pectinovorum]|uniref:hypothetical protein n=1 Tax=Flavobacterium pectinovorum TaxID=29533 RepID=UPI001FACB831|nr:hypothetical protein [Flavobacterium pectinovorum]MCI9844851.1 hypothetical protein [Flavobacterium pectinovorum]